MTDQQMAEILRAQVAVFKILRDEIWALKIFLQKSGVVDPEEFSEFRAQVEKQMVAQQEIEELERLLAKNPDKSPEEPSS